MKTKPSSSKTPPHIKTLQAQALKNPIRKHLLAGKGVVWVSSKLGISTERIYEYAKKHSLPTNRPFKPNSKRAQNIIQALTLGTPAEVAAAYRITVDLARSLKPRTPSGRRTSK